MSPAVRTHNLRPLHPQRAIRMSRNSAWDVIEIRRPAATGLELLVCGIEGGIAAGASINTGGGCMFVVFTYVRRLGALLPEDTKLFCIC